ncbi:MAG TPA: hypothetical protein VGK71_05030, partial [Nitrospirota bacterium]
NGAYTNYQDVPASMAGNPPSAEITDVQISNYTDPDFSNAYYVVICSYDKSHNYSTLSAQVDRADPYPNVTGFSQSGSDTTNNLPKPPAPQSLVAQNYSTIPQIKLSWASMASNPNIVGYRVYRKETAFAPSDFPMKGDIETISPSITMLARDPESGSGWTGSVLDATATTYTDKDVGLVGCKTYYYAVCAVTYDRSRIWGGPLGKNDEDGMYTSAQYATASTYPGERLKPKNPVISTGSKPGWKRAFIQHTAPTLNEDNTPLNDYLYTKLYYTYTQGSADVNAPPPPDPEAPPIDDAHLLPKNIEGLGLGTVKSDRTIIFNSLSDPNYPEGGAPQLPVNSKFKILAVAYDHCNNISDTTVSQAFTLATLCGDEPAGYPNWQGCSSNPASVWFAANDIVTKDTSYWTPYAKTGTPYNSSIDVYWSDLDKVSQMNEATPCSGGMIDFQGYCVRESTSSSFPSILTYSDFNTGNGDVIQLWDNTRKMSNLNEGGTYYFCIQSTDCYFWSRVGAGGNISPNNSYPAGGIKPGRIILGLSPYNVGITQGTYHNKVKFYIQNTSSGTLSIESMYFKWLNDSATLTGITIGTAPTISVPHGLNSLTSVIASADLSQIAGGPLMPSAYIPVELEFKNIDDTVNNFTDMRDDTISVEFKFKNNSMNVGGFTTGSINDDARVMKVGVTRGPSVSFVKQDKPENPTDAFVVINSSANILPPSGMPEVSGGQPVNIIAQVIAPSVETIDAVNLNYAVTDTTAATPGAAVFSSAAMTGTGSDFSAVVPGQIDKSVWYYVTASTLQGNNTRFPNSTADYFYYKQLSLDPCNETPLPATGLKMVAGPGVTLNWTAPTAYESGNLIQSSGPYADPLKYDVYRYILGGAGFPATPLAAGTGLTTTSFSDATTDPSFSYVYGVRVRNSCTSQVRQSDFSNQVIKCGTVGNALTTDAGSISLNSNWDAKTCTPVPVALRAIMCASISNTVFNETVAARIVSSEGTTNLTLHEKGDTGVFSPLGTGDALADNIFVTSQNFGTTSDNIIGATRITNLADTVQISILGGTVNASVAVNTSPCANTPTAVKIVHGDRSGNGDTVVLKWSTTVLNTDGSTSNDVDASTFEVRYALTTESTPANYIVVPGTTTVSGGQYVFTGTVPSKFTTYKFYVLAKDKCAPTANKSAISNIVTISKGDYLTF